MTGAGAARPSPFSLQLRTGRNPLTPIVHLNSGFSLAAPIRMMREGSKGSFLVASSSRLGMAGGIVDADITLREPVADPDTHPAEFAAEMLAICIEGNVNLLFPQRGAIAIADEAAAFRAAGIDVLTAGDGDTLRLLDDKWDFTVDTARAGLPIAITRHVSDVASFDEHVAEIRGMGLDACVKPPIGVYGAGYWRLDDSITLFEQMMDPDARRLATGVMRDAVASAKPEGRLLVCEYLPGDEWSVDAACHEGRILTAVARVKHGRTRTLHVEGPAMDIARETIGLFGLSGIVNVQMKERADGTPALLEVNARMSGGCMMTSFAGVNIPLVGIATRLGLMDEASLAKPIGGIQVSAVDDAVAIGDTRVTFSDLRFGN